MYKSTKNIVQKISNKMGYHIVKLNQKGTEVTPLNVALELLSGLNETLWVVQIGANDGLINDPIADFTRQNANKIIADLIEPQKLLIPYLEKNYSFLASKKIHNVAIGETSVLTLYQIKPEFWDELEVPYASKWPSYRAPTGVTSSNRQHVINWLKSHYKGKTKLDEMLTQIEVNSKKLSEILINPPKKNIDVLQVDVEGLDDEVIYNSSVDIYCPKIINFEVHHLSEDRKQNLNSWLENIGYTVFPYGGDCVAIKKNE